jgi:hypothetical protein
MPVRPLAEGDIPQVADLYWRVLRGRQAPTPASVHSFLRELYFTNPWIDPALPSLVYDDKGNIAGFLGVVPRKMCLNGEPLCIAYGGNFVVAPEFRTTLAGLHLLRTYMAGSQDLSQTDSANDISRALLERLGFTTIVPLSIHWVRPLRPARSLTYAIARLTHSGLSGWLEFLSKPLCAGADRLAARLSFSPFRQGESHLHASELEVETLLCCMAEFRGDFSLWPEYDSNSLSWLLNFMERMQGHGKHLKKVILRDDKNNVVGWYIYYFSKDGFAEVAQIGGARSQIKAILDHLFLDAWNMGAIALHGTVHQGLMDLFSDKNCFFSCRGGWTLAHSRNPTLLELLNNGDALLSRLDGEWCLAFGV